MTDRSDRLRAPELSFPKGWKVQIVPCSGPSDAYIRFTVRTRNAEPVSVYFDTEQVLGSMGQPYWEIYPYCDGDTRRFLVGEESKMIRAISRACYSQFLAEYKKRNHR